MNLGCVSSKARKILHLILDRNSLFSSRTQLKNDKIPLKDEEVFIRITDMPQTPFDICTNDDIEKQKNEFRLFFDGNWRYGKEIRQIFISLRFYQVTPTKSQS